MTKAKHTYKNHVRLGLFKIALNPSENDKN